MMSGILTPAFLQAAGNAHAVKNTIALTLKEGQADPIFAIAGTGKVTIASTKGGEAIKQTVTLTDDAPVQVSIQADGGTMVTLIGNVIALALGENTGMSPMYAYVTGIDASENPTLQKLYCGKCADLTQLILTTNTELDELDLTDCTGLTTIKYPATNSDVATAIAGAITAATAADGTVYTDSAGTYYSTIADAATAKGWTITQL